ncbi:MAG: GNAT family N-acetyltransferase, partial [Chloroflexi bacterium]|nr:GNAT family N-acetyltransferase [Chloroflexota bacterium]
AWKYGYISWLGVAPEVQRKHLGDRLCRAVERIMKDDGVRMILVDTEAGNTPAVSFFKRQGFTSRRSHVWLGKTLKPSAKSAGLNSRAKAVSTRAKGRLPKRTSD